MKFTSEESLLHNRSFEDLLLEAIDETLSSLGESSKEAILFHLKKRFNIKKQAIPYKIEAFASAIEEIFGLGSSFLEILIMKSLHEKIGGSFEWSPSKDLTFIEYVAAAKRSFLKMKNKKPKKAIKEAVFQCEEVTMQS